MLVLTRRRAESIVVSFGGTTVTITVVEVRPDGKVRIGIDAPREVAVHREEIWRLIQAQESKEEDDKANDTR